VKVGKNYEDSGSLDQVKVGKNYEDSGSLDSSNITQRNEGKLFK